MVPGVLYRVIYGSPFPEEWQKGLTHVRPALLRDFRRHKVKFCDYPAIVPFEGASVRGSICTGLTDGDIHRLDTFEGPEYYKERVKVKVLKPDVGMDMIDETKLDELVVEEAEANVYIWKEEGRDMLEEDEWDFETFKRKKMKKWTGQEAGGFDEVDSGFAEADKAGQGQEDDQKRDPLGGRAIDGHIGRELKELENATV